MNDFCVWHDEKPFYICTNLIDFDFSRVHGWLTNAYWSKGVSMDTVVRAFSNSLSFGLYHKEDGQVGCARVITDKTTFAYLSDIFIDDSARGAGLGKWMMQIILDHEELQGLRRIMLATSDMHPLYRQFGFTEPADPAKLMEKLDPNVRRILYGED